MEQWIKAKYERKQYAMREMPNPDDIPGQGEAPKQAAKQPIVSQDTRAQKQAAPKELDLMSSFDIFEQAPTVKAASTSIAPNPVSAPLVPSSVTLDIMSMFNTPAKAPVAQTSNNNNDSFWSQMQSKSPVTQQPTKQSPFPDFASFSQPLHQQQTSVHSNQFTDFTSSTQHIDQGMHGMKSMGSGFTNQFSQNKPAASAVSFGSFTEPVESTKIPKAKEIDDWGAFQ